MNGNRRKLLVLLPLLALFAVVAGVLVLSALPHRVTVGQAFIQHSIELEDNNLIDIGVVDFDGDGNLDIYTVAHHSAQSLLKGDGHGGFEDVFSQLGLDAQPQFPGVEISADPPNIDEPGLYVYWSNSGLVLEWLPDSSMSHLAGTIELTSEVNVQESSGFELRIEESRLANGPPQSEIRFEASSPGRAVISTPLIALPVKFTISDDLDPGQIFIGRHSLSPPDNSFEMFLNDRHGMAWADYNGNGRKSVFISRGGLHGRMALLPYTFHDELFTWESDRFVNVAEKSGLRKDGCPGYNAQWVDFDNDGYLDIYVACHHAFPNQLFRNLGSGLFEQMASHTGLDVSDGLTDTPFTWIAAGPSHALDLLIATESGVQHFRRTDEKYTVVDVFPLHGVSQMSVSDFNSDGNLDVFVASYKGMSSILLNDGTQFKVVSANELGLPSSSLTASWVDFDNDGNTDLYLVPGGLFHQTPAGTFEATGLLRHSLPWVVKRSRASWLDFNNDGNLDLILAVNYELGLFKGVLRRLLGKWAPEWTQDERNFQWKVSLFENIGTSKASQNGWLQVQLDGPETNPQAIGATVELKQGQDRTVIAQVGQADGSHMSQGHYRVYFGLGQAGLENISLRVNWPDGTRSDVLGFEVNRLLSISYE